jgi:hypothetical protein
MMQVLVLNPRRVHAVYRAYLQSAAPGTRCCRRGATRLQMATMTPRCWRTCGLLRWATSWGSPTPPGSSPTCVRITEAKSTRFAHFLLMPPSIASTIEKRQLLVVRRIYSTRSLAPLQPCGTSSVIPRPVLQGYSAAAGGAGSLSVGLHQHAAQQGHMPALLAVGDAFWCTLSAYPSTPCSVTTSAVSTLLRTDGAQTQTVTAMPLRFASACL